MKISILLFASTIHSENYYMDQCKSVMDKISGMDVSVTQMYDSNREAPEADVYIAAILTGGTSSLAFRALSRLSKPTVIVAKGMHNALASALSLRARLESTGLKTVLIPIEDNDDYGSKVKEVVDALKVTEELRRLRILEINENGSIGEGASKYLKVFGGFIDAVSIDDLVKLIGDLDEEGAKRLLNEKSPHIHLGENLVDSLRVAHLASVLKRYAREKNFDVLMVDCFPLIMKLGYTPCYAVSILNSEDTITVCESDYHSLPLMYLSRRLTGFQGFVANPSGYTNDGIVRFSHCTIAYSIGKDCKLTPHFETGRPYAVTCKYLFGKVAIMRFNWSFTKLKVYKGDVAASGLLTDGYCRTQLYVRIKGVEPRDFYRDTYGNHHVIAPLINGFIDKLHVVSWWMGWELKEIG